MNQMPTINLPVFPILKMYGKPCSQNADRCCQNQKRYLVIWRSKSPTLYLHRSALYKEISFPVHSSLPHFYMCASVSMYVVFMCVCLCEPLPVRMCVDAKGGRLVPNVSGSTSFPWDWVFQWLWIKAGKSRNFSDPVLSNPHSSAGFIDTCVVCLHGCWETKLRPLSAEPLQPFLFHSKLLYQESLSSLSHQYPC